MTQETIKKTVPAFLMVTAIVFLASCDNTLEPFDEGRGFYSIYGALDLNGDEQYLRINDLNTPITEDSTALPDVRVTLTDLHEGTQETLQDSTMQFDGHYVSNFIASMDIKPETRYELTVEGPGDQYTSATATTPPRMDVSMNHQGPAIPDCSSLIEISLYPVDEPQSIRLQFGLTYDGHTGWYHPLILNSHINDGELTLQFTYSFLILNIFPPDFFGSVSCEDLDEDKSYISFERYGPDWHDDEVETFENGLGRFSGFYDSLFTYPVDTTSSL